MKITNYLKLARIHQPTGIFLLFLPCLFGIFLSLKKLPQIDFMAILQITFLFFLGAIFMRSAGCVVNDIVDIKFDSLVERTKNRPLASKKISKKNAIIFAILLLLCAFFVLLQFNARTIISGFFILNFVLLYPLMKRLTYYPQIFLGITFNFGVLMASLAILNFITEEALILYVTCVIWTLIYDTIYAFQDIEDDLKIGVKSSAIAFSKNAKLILNSLNLSMLFLLFYLGVKSDFGLIFFILIFFGLGFMSYKITFCNFKNPQNCLHLFKQNAALGILIAAAILLA